MRFVMFYYHWMEWDSGCKMSQKGMFRLHKMPNHLNLLSVFDTVKIVNVIIYRCLIHQSPRWTDASLSLLHAKSPREQD